MEQRISLMTLGVTDVAQSRHCYAHGLGWHPSSASTEQGTFFQTGSMVLALSGKMALAQDAHLSPEGMGFGGIALAYNVRQRAEVETVLAEAQAAGATILKSAQETDWGGYAGYFADPDGYPWEVAWNPHFPLCDDGSVQLPQ